MAYSKSANLKDVAVDMEKCIRIVQAKFSQPLSDIQMQNCSVRVFALDSVNTSRLSASELGDGYLELIEPKNCRRREFERFTCNDQDTFILSAISDAYENLVDRCIKHTIMNLKLQEEQNTQIDESSLEGGNLWNWRIVTCLSIFLSTWITILSQNNLPFPPCIDS